MQCVKIESDGNMGFRKLLTGKMGTTVESMDKWEKDESVAYKATKVTKYELNGEFFDSIEDAERFMRRLVIEAAVKLVIYDTGATSMSEVDTIVEVIEKLNLGSLATDIASVKVYTDFD